MFGLSGSAVETLSAIRRSNAVIEFDLDGKILSANQIFLDLMGYTLPEIVGKHHAIFVDASESSSPAYAGFWAALRAGQHQVDEFRRFAKGGREVWIQGNYVPVLRRGKPFKVVKIATDISAIQIERARMHSKLAAMDRSQAVIEFTIDGKIVAANENFLATVGYTLDEIIGQHHRIFVEQEEVASAAYRQLWEKLAAGDFQSAQYKRIGKGGRVVWIQASYNPLYDAAGRLKGVIKFASDITAAKDAERRFLDEANKKISDSVGTIGNAIASTNQQATSAAAAAVQASTNVNAVAAGASQLTSSVQEINSQVVKALDVSNEAVKQAQQAGSTIQSLVDDARKISSVVDLISTIAAQTNLLALNATIEAARAGDAGRGFAVVAGEVKNLAAQTARATGEISAHILAVQSSSEEARAAIEGISGTISSINAISVSISAAVEEQSAVTSDMAQNMQQAAKGVEMITHSMEEVAQLTQDADDGIARILEAGRYAA